MKNPIVTAGTVSMLLLLMAGCGSSGSSGPPPPMIATTSLPGGTIGTAYSQSIEVTGGTPPFAWTVSSGTLPDNLTLGNSSSTEVALSGTPDRVQPNVAFSITVTDANQRTSTQSFSLSIAGTPSVAVTQSGALQGMATGNLYAFRGIPFAAPPVGNLRWKAPQPPASWEGVRDATKFGNVCPQINSARQYAGDEDCLVLNVYVSQTPPNQTQPVMVFFHGGGNVNGDTQYTPTSLDAPPLADQGVVLVTAEYRLGFLGFLATPQLAAESGSTGDYALRDMIAALTWVHQNIAAFGGDPTHVMLFGQSAGAFNIQMLMASPLVPQGLYAVAGMESGAAPLASDTTWFPTYAGAQAGSAPFISAMGCAAAADVLACLRAVPAETIVNYATRGVYLTGLGPGIGSPFLPVDSILYLQQNGPPVPLLIGSNGEEWSLSDSPTAQMDAAAYAAAIHQRFDQFGPNVANNVLALYPTSAYASPAYALIAVDGDYQLGCELRSVVRAAAVSTNHKPIWRYLYTKTFENDPNEVVYGAFHTAELFFLFGNFNDGQQPGGGLVYTPSAADLTFSQSLMGYWTRFAATGNPNGAGAVAWPPYDPSTDSMLQLDDTFVAINGYHNPQCDYLVTLPQP